MDVNVDEFDPFLIYPSIDDDVKEKKKRRNLRKMLMENKSLLYSPNDDCELQSPVADPITYQAFLNLK